jgi:hypothetical protein
VVGQRDVAVVAAGDVLPQDELVLAGAPDGLPEAVSRTIERRDNLVAVVDEGLFDVGRPVTRP